MPISADPNATAEYVLDGDKDKPDRPTFIVRYMTRREHARVRELTDRASKEPDDASAFKLVSEAVLIGLVGWRNMIDRDGNPLEFSPNAWDAPLSDMEIWELAWNYPRAVRLAEHDLFLSRSQTLSATEKSAEAAPVASA